MNSIGVRWAGVAVVGLVAMWLLTGCGGHGGGGWTRMLTGVVVVDNFVVAAGERVGARGDVVVQCQTATVDGELISQDSTGAGANGGSITIEAQNDIVVTGHIVAGNGTAGAATGEGGNGGAGGNVTLSSASGNVALGAVAVVAAAELRPRQVTGGASLQSGNGGNGGNGLFGGAGGAGGDITIECPEGTWHITPGPNLLVFGNGGSGGNGNLPAAQLGDVTIPETLPNAGGNAGRLAGNVGGVEGVEVGDVTDPDGNPASLIELPQGTVAGWEGGDAGSSTCGVEVGAAGHRAGGLRPQQAASPVTTRGARGGIGAYVGGDGASVEVDAEQATSLEPGTDIKAWGGSGGDANPANLMAISTRGRKIIVDGKVELHGGKGGNARAVGTPGRTGGAGQDGGPGGAAEAMAGSGGWVSDLYAEHEDRHIHPGAGGNAVAVGGRGGPGGNGTASSRGGHGGAGGTARAFGGGGGCYGWTSAGANGDAAATGGKGGDGGDGRPIGTGGAGGVANAWGGTTQEGHPPSPPGNATQTPGAPGADGELLNEPPTPVERNYGVAQSQCTHQKLLLKLLAYLWTGILPMQAGATEITVPAFVSPGETVYVNTARTKMWIGTHVNYWRYDNLLTNPQTAAMFVTGGAVTRVGSFWLDETRDLLYGLANGQQKVYVWQNASTATGNNNPARTIDLSGVVPTGLAGDSTADRLFVRANAAGSILVLDNASTRSGATTASRTMTGLPTLTYGTGLAYDRHHNTLYVGLNQAVGRILGAAMRNGAVAPTLIQGPATGLTDEAVSLDVFGDTDLLFVANYYQSMLVFENATTISGNVAYQQRDTAVTRINAVAAFVEP